MNKKHVLCLSLVAGIYSLSYNHAEAHLGGFEYDDGYRDFRSDVERYNAGQFGPNSGGGTYVPYSAANYGSGLWQKLEGNTSGAYATAHFGRDRTRSQDPALSTTANGQPKALVITTNSDGWNAGAQKFNYKLDSFDLGMDPSSVNGSAKVSFDFWSCPGRLTNNTMTSDFYGNSIAFKDSSGNVGITVGYKMAMTTGIATLAYNVDGTWVDTGIVAADNYYQQWQVDLDLATDTVSLKLVDGGYRFLNQSTGTISTKGTGSVTTFLTNVAMNQNMSNVTDLELVSSPGVGNSKQWQLDDFAISVDPAPEPSSTALLGLGALGLLIRRKRD